MREIQHNLRQIQQIGKQTKEFLIHPEYCPALKNYHIRLAGISLTAPQFQFINLPVLYSQILVGFRGNGKVLINGQWKNCGAGEAYCTPRGNVSGYMGAKGWEVGWITFEASAPAWDFQEAVLLEIDPRPLEHILKGLHHDATGQKEPGLLEHWVELLHSHTHRITASKNPGKLWRVWQKVQANLSAPWDLVQLAALAGVSAEYLRRISLQETGLTPMRYVTRLRMQKAISLLSQNYKVEEVSVEVGYENAFAFSTAFKKFSGYPPSFFQKN